MRELEQTILGVLQGYHAKHPLSVDQLYRFVAGTPEAIKAAGLAEKPTATAAPEPEVEEVEPAEGDGPEFCLWSDGSLVIQDDDTTYSFAPADTARLFRFLRAAKGVFVGAAN